MRYPEFAKPPCSHGGKFEAFHREYIIYLRSKHVPTGHLVGRYQHDCLLANSAASVSNKVMQVVKLMLSHMLTNCDGQSIQAQQ